MASSLPRRSALPPVDYRTLTHEVRSELGIAKVAELPQFLRRPRILKEDLINLEGVQLAVTEALEHSSHVLLQ